MSHPAVALVPCRAGAELWRSVAASALDAYSVAAVLGVSGKVSMRSWTMKSWRRIAMPFAPSSVLVPSSDARSR